jgi:t-SNARE complex subunit (syntaxin)
MHRREGNLRIHKDEATEGETETAVSDVEGELPSDTAQGRASDT